MGQHGKVRWRSLRISTGCRIRSHPLLQTTLHPRRLRFPPRSSSSSHVAGAVRPKTALSAAVIATCCRLPARASIPTRGVRTASSSSCAVRRRSAIPRTSRDTDAVVASHQSQVPPHESFRRAWLQIRLELCRSRADASLACARRRQSPAPLTAATRSRSRAPCPTAESRRHRHRCRAWNCSGARTALRPAGWRPELQTGHWRRERGCSGRPAS